MIAFQEGQSTNVKATYGVRPEYSQQPKATFRGSKTSPGAAVIQGRGNRTPGPHGYSALGRGSCASALSAPQDTKSLGLRLGTSGYISSPGLLLTKYYKPCDLKQQKFVSQF